MNYNKVYLSIIEKRRKYPLLIAYTENHHIFPRSLGGNDKKENLVKLTAREHFICHLLLTHIHKNDRVAYKKMVKAFGMMLWMHGENQERYKVNSHKYQRLKEEFSKIRQEEQTGVSNCQFGSCWITDGLINKKIKKNEPIPENWYVGRNLLSLRVKHFCNGCNVEFNYRKNGDYPINCNLCREKLGYRVSSAKIQSKRCIICNALFIKRKVKTCSEKCKQEFSRKLNRHRSCKRIECLQTGEIFNSLTEAAFKIGSSIALISYVLSGDVSSAKGFTFRFMAE